MPSSGGGRRLDDTQARLYSALFGVPPPEMHGAAPSAASDEESAGYGRQLRSQSADNSAASAAMGGVTSNSELATQISRAVRKAMRGAAIERQQAVDEAVARARESFDVELREAIGQMEDEKEAAIAQATARAEAAAQQERAGVSREYARDRSTAVARAVEAAEKAAELQLRKALAAKEEECEMRLEAAARDKESALRKAARVKDAAVSDAMKAAREKVSAVRPSHSLTPLSLSLTMPPSPGL